MHQENNLKVDISSTSIEKGIDLAKGFLQSLIKPSIDEVGLLISDKIKYWRFKNQINILLKAHSLIEKRGLKVKEISLKVLCPLLEGASYEEDESLKSKWAALLVNYANADNNINTSLFVTILQQISPVEAMFLDLIKKNNFPKSYLDKDGLIKETKIQEYELENLGRLNLITDQKRKLSGKFNATVSPRNFFYLTSLGEEFLKMCTIE